MEMTNVKWVIILSRKFCSEKINLVPVLLRHVCTQYYLPLSTIWTQVFLNRVWPTGSTKLSSPHFTPECVEWVAFPGWSKLHLHKTSVSGRSKPATAAHESPLSNEGKELKLSDGSVFVFPCHLKNYFLNYISECFLSSNTLHFCIIKGRKT